MGAGEKYLTRPTVPIHCLIHLSIFLKMNSILRMFWQSRVLDQVIREKEENSMIGNQMSAGCFWMFFLRF